MKTSKRKRTQSLESSEHPVKQKYDGYICVLHNPTTEDNSHFTPFCSVKCDPSEKLLQLLEIRDKRLAQPSDSPLQMREICEQLPETLEGLDLKKTGYHRRCYQYFTVNLNRLKSVPSTPQEPSTSTRHHSPRKQTQDRIFPPDECIFCERNEIKLKGQKTQRPTRTFPAWKNKDSGWQKIEKMAEEIGDDRLYRKVKDVDLFAAEAHCHDFCYHNFFRNHGRHKIKTPTIEDTEQTTMDYAHRAAYENVKDMLKMQVIDNEQVIPLTAFRDRYVTELDSHGILNPEYRSSKLKTKFEKDEELNSKICFTKISVNEKGCFSFWVVYSTSISLSDAIACAYQLGSTDQIKDTAQYLRQVILKAFKKSPALPWPPTADELEKRAPEELPEELKQFLTLVLSGSQSVDKSDKIQRLVYSIGEDLCRAVTNGEWKLSKHLLLCTTIRHLYRSKQLTTILHRLGHSECYDFGLELETAMAKALDDESTYLTPNIICGEGNVVFHNEWDNLNKITSNIHGSNVVNSAGGIMIQEVKADTLNNPDRTLPLYDRSKERSLTSQTPEILPPVTIYNRESPKFPEDASFVPPDGQVYETILREYYMWLLCRTISSKGKQEIPGLAGFISLTGKAPARKSTIDYYTPINQPITQYETVQELLQISEKATQEVGQKYTINTFDLGVCMKALPLVWKYPGRFKDHIIIPGPFHTSMNYIGMITNHKCLGSGYSEILLESNLVTSGCLKSVLSGKAYAKALFCLKTVCEALERLLLEVFVEEMDVQLSPEALFTLIESCTREHLNEALQDASTLAIIEQYLAFQDKVRNGHLGKTAMFWLSVMDHQRLVFMLITAVKTNNRQLFHVCNGKMANLFFAYDGPNYARYLAWFEAFMTNLESSHPGAMKLIDSGVIAVARSLIPGSLCAVDKTMEETFMKFAKSAGGLSGIFQMYAAYQRWCRTTSTRAQYVEKLLEMCGMMTDPESSQSDKHPDLQRASIRKGEDAVQRTEAAIRNFMNPFRIPVPSKPEDDRLYALHSGAPVPKEAEIDVLRAESLGEQKKLNFITERFKNQEKGFFDPINREKLMTMEHANKKIRLTTSQGKVIQYQEQSDLAFTLLVKSQLLEEPLNLDELMQYSLSPVPHCLGTPDGFFAKTNKASMLHYILTSASNEVQYPENAFFIQDGNALFHSLLNLPPTFGEICLQILDHLVPKKNFIFSTDSYHEHSIKAQERQRRGTGERFIVEGPSTRKPKDFKCFLANDQNKMQLCQLLLKVWGSSEASSRIQKCATAIVVVDGKAHQLHPSDGQAKVSEVHELRSDQEETDTRVVIYLKYAENQGFTSAVVRTPDSDIFFILLYHTHDLSITVFLDTGTGKNRKLINVSEIADELGRDWCSTLLGFYVFSGEDCTSAFKGKGKVAPLKVLQRCPKFHSAFRQLGLEWTLQPSVIRDLEAFTCTMYGQARETSVNVVRGKMLKKMVGEDCSLNSKSKVDLVRLPPCQDSLIPHLQRVNHRLGIFKRAPEQFTESPNPFEDGQGWAKTPQGGIEPVWSIGPVLPQSLLDLLNKSSQTESTSTSEESEDMCDEGDIDIDDLIESEEEDMD